MAKDKNMVSILSGTKAGRGGRDSLCKLPAANARENSDSGNSPVRIL
jgi:hypothetical protein